MDTSFGIQQKGKRNLITDVAGITVGHCTLADGDVQTGVTALLPHQGDLFHDRCPMARPECAQIMPQLREVEPEHFVACHLVEPQSNPSDADKGRDAL